MATPLGAARGLARLLPPGPVLELCCGAGGATRALAKRGPVLAVDKDPDRLAQARQNLADMGLLPGAQFLACDLARPALAVGGAGFAACLLDPDWSPAGANLKPWAASLAQMQPPADELLRLALAMSPLAALRLPPGLASLPPGQVLEARQGGRLKFVYLLAGPWPKMPACLEISA